MRPDRRGIICAGNWIVDLVHDVEHWPDESNLVRINAQSRGIGGGAANVISALARLQTDLPLWPMGAIGDDEPGTFIQDQCRQLGLPTEKLHIKTGIPTAHTHVMSVPGQSRTFFYQGGANDALSSDDFPAGTFAHTQARVFYLGYLSLLGDLDDFDASGTTGAAKVLERARSAGMMTCVDLVSIVHPNFQEIVQAAAPFIDFLIVNEIEAKRALGEEGSIQTASEPDTLRRMARALLHLGIGRAAIVHCAERVVWCDKDGQDLLVDIDPLAPDAIVSHLGAGDAFCAGLLYGVHEGWSPGRTVKLANATARASLRGHTAAEAIPTLTELVGSE